jgi:arginase family enzyme
MLNELIIPASELEVVKQFKGGSDQLGHYLKDQVWDTRNLPGVAILGIPEGRGSVCEDVALAPDSIRYHLYRLAKFSPEFQIVDLGNVRCGKSTKDTYAAVRMVAEELSALNIPVLILGGGQDTTVPIIAGFNSQQFKLIIVDDRVDNSSLENSPADESYINNLPNGTSLTVIAGQSYFFGQNDHELFGEGFNGEIITLGNLRSDANEMEPLIRNSNLVSFDFGSLKFSEAPGQYRISPNGLSGEEACQISWYSGISTSPVWFGIFGYSPTSDITTSGAMMAAQICWYFFNGITKRLDTEPVDEATDFEAYPVAVDGLDEDITFLRHPVSHRWWMEVPSDDCTNFPVRVPCSKKDYHIACKKEIPERWWKYFNKIY